MLEFHVLAISKVPVTQLCRASYRLNPHWIYLASPGLVGRLLEFCVLSTSKLQSMQLRRAMYRFNILFVSAGHLVYSAGTGLVGWVVVGVLYPGTI